MKILINRKPVEGPWGGGNNFVKSFYDHIPNFGHNIVSSLSDNPDIIFIMDPRYENGQITINEAIAYNRINPHSKIIQRINECDARKGTKDVDLLLKECSKHIHKTLFVSEWMMNYHLKKGWHCKDNSILINGVYDYYKPQPKINNGKVNIVTHHWSDNFMKGFDYYNMIDDLVGKRDDITFTYIGRERGTFKNTKVIPPLFGKELARELGRYDIYVTASRYDPGPNHVLESLACKIPTYSFIEGGGSCEFTGKSHIYKDFESLKSILLTKDFKQNRFEIRNWKKCMEELNENTLLQC